MTPTFPFVRPRPTPNSFVLAVQLRGAPTRQQRHHFFVRLHSEARHQGLVMGQKWGLCVFFGAERLCTNHSRHQMINWLVEHSQVRTIEVSRLEALSTLFQADGPLIRALGTTAHEDKEAMRACLERAAWGAVQQWAAYLWGAL
jgi:hypothetical protein